jgi:hypothetical protein
VVQFVEELCHKREVACSIPDGGHWNFFIGTLLPAAIWRAVSGDVGRGDLRYTANILCVLTLRWRYNYQIA